MILTFPQNRAMSPPFLFRNPVVTRPALAADVLRASEMFLCCVCLACCILALVALVALVASAGFSWIVCVQNQKFMCKTISSLRSTHVQKASISPQVPQVQKPNLIKFASSASGFLDVFGLRGSQGQPLPNEGT